MLKANFLGLTKNSRFINAKPLVLSNRSGFINDFTFLEYRYYTKQALNQSNSFERQKNEYFQRKKPLELSQNFRDDLKSRLHSARNKYKPKPKAKYSDKFRKEYAELRKKQGVEDEVHQKNFGPVPKPVMETWKSLFDASTQTETTTTTQLMTNDKSNKTPIISNYYFTQTPPLEVLTKQKEVLLKTLDLSQTPKSDKTKPQQQMLHTPPTQNNNITATPKTHINAFTNEENPLTDEGEFSNFEITENTFTNMEENFEIKPNQTILSPTSIQTPSLRKPSSINTTPLYLSQNPPLVSQSIQKKSPSITKESNFDTNTNTTPKPHSKFPPILDNVEQKEISKPPSKSPPKESTININTQIPLNISHTPSPLLNTSPNNKNSTPQFSPQATTTTTTTTTNTANTTTTNTTTTDTTNTEKLNPTLELLKIISEPITVKKKSSKSKPEISAKKLLETHLPYAHPTPSNQTKTTPLINQTKPTETSSSNTKKSKNKQQPKNDTKKEPTQISTSEMSTPPSIPLSNDEKQVQTPTNTPPKTEIVNPSTAKSTDIDIQTTEQVSTHDTQIPPSEILQSTEKNETPLLDTQASDTNQTDSILEQNNTTTKAEPTTSTSSDQTVDTNNVATETPIISVSEPIDQMIDTTTQTPIATPKRKQRKPPTPKIDAHQTITTQTLNDTTQTPVATVPKKRSGGIKKTLEEQLVITSNTRTRELFYQYLRINKVQITDFSKIPREEALEKAKQSKIDLLAFFIHAFDSYGRTIDREKTNDILEVFEFMMTNYAQFLSSTADFIVRLILRCSMNKEKKLGILETIFETNPELYGSATSLGVFFIKNDRIDLAKKVLFERFKGGNRPSLVFVNAVLKALGKAGDLKEVSEYLSFLKSNNIILFTPMREAIKRVIVYNSETKDLDELEKKYENFVTEAGYEVSEDDLNLFRDYSRQWVERMRDAVQTKLQKKLEFQRERDLKLQLKRDKLLATKNKET